MGAITQQAICRNAAALQQSGIAIPDERRKTAGRAILLQISQYIYWLLPAVAVPMWLLLTPRPMAALSGEYADVPIWME